MKLHLMFAWGAVGLAAALAYGFGSFATSPTIPTDRAPAVGQPSGFVPNLGQWRRPESCVARIGGALVGAHPTGFSLVVDRRAAPVGMRFLGARAVEPVAEERLAGVHHYFLGNDPARWRTDVPRFRQVRWREPWPGVDVVVMSCRRGRRC